MDVGDREQVFEDPLETDVFAVVDLSGTNDPVSAGLMLKFVNRVAKLR